VLRPQHDNVSNSTPIPTYHAPCEPHQPRLHTRLGGELLAGLHEIGSGGWRIPVLATGAEAEAEEERHGGRWQVHRLRPCHCGDSCYWYAFLHIILSLRSRCWEAYSIPARSLLDYWAVELTLWPLGSSFVITKKGLNEANERHGFEGDGFSYFKSGTWWGGIILSTFCWMT
jgi:hypothetical protein